MLFKQSLYIRCRLNASLSSPGFIYYVHLIFTFFISYYIFKIHSVVEENAFCTMRCKLFFKKGSDWKELGVGMLYLKSLNDGKTQLLVRMETAAGKVLLNISLHKNIPVARVGKNNVSVMSVPNPPVFLKETEGDNTKPLNYLIRVKNSEEADDLLKQINDNKIKD